MLRGPMVFLIALTIAVATGAAGAFDAPQRDIIGPKKLCFKYSSFPLLWRKRT